jgi:Pyruvate/2-oxoacid:ferredoxin oxidoreductase delta subunit
LTILPIGDIIPVMKCEICEMELVEKRVLAEMDSENQRIVTYLYCMGCDSIHNSSGELIIPSKVDETIEDVV